MHTYARRHICPSARVNASAALGQLVLVGTCCSHLGSCCTWRALEQRTSEFQVAMRLNKPPGTRMLVGICALRHFCSWADMMCCACSSAFVLHILKSAQERFACRACNCAEGLPSTSVQTSANDGQGRAVAALFLDLSEQAGDHRNSYVNSLINCPATDFAKSIFSLLFPSANFICLISEHLA